MKRGLRIEYNNTLHPKGPPAGQSGAGGRRSPPPICSADDSGQHAHVPPIAPPRTLKTFARAIGQLFLHDSRQIDDYVAAYDAIKQRQGGLR